MSSISSAAGDATDNGGDEPIVPDAPTVLSPPEEGEPVDATTSEERKINLRESERLLFFTDAVVAIAATLLILPLMEAATSFGDEESRRRTEEVGAEETGESMPEEEAGVKTTADFFRQHGGQMWAFLLSFWLVATQFWRGHAFLFATVERVSIYLYIGTMVWLLSVVFFPISASLLYGVADTASDTTASLTYLGVVWANNIIILVLKILVRRDPRTWSEEYGSPTEYSLFRSIVVVGIGAVSMVVGGTIPSNGWAAIFLYVLARPIRLLILKCRPQLNQKRSMMDVEHEYYLNASFFSEVFRYLTRTAKGRLAQTNVEKKEEASSNGPETDIPTENNTTETPDPATSTNGMLAKKSVLLLMSDRLIVFTDATVAISMTLLIIPLMEKSSELEDATASDFFAENGQLFGVFVLSFFVIAYRWVRHDNMFAFIEGHVPADFMVFNTPWLLSITFMPVATALSVMNDNIDDRSKYGVYLGTLLFNLLVSVALAFIVYRENRNFPPRKVVEAIVAVILCALGLLIAMLIPSTGHYMPLLVFFSLPATSLLLRIWPNLQHLVVKMA